MKKVLLTLLTVIVVAGVLAGAGFAGYRIGYQQGAHSTVTTNATPNNKMPFIHPFGFQNMPMHNFGRDLDRDIARGFGPSGFGMRGGMGFLSPLMFLGRILFWALIIWFAYWLFTKSGWKLTRATQPVENPKVEASTTQEKEG